MNQPPLLLACALLFWGWESGFLMVAVVGAVILELPRWVRGRWDFSATDMNRVWDLCGVLFLGAGVYAYATTDLVAGPTRFMTWLPMIFFPFVAATLFSSQDNVSRSTYFLMVRIKQRGASLRLPPLGRYVPYWYLVVCFAAASIVNVRDVRFYCGVVVIGSWLLWLSRNRTAPLWAWMSVVIGVSVAGFGGHLGLTHIQSIIENRASQLMADFGEPDIDLGQTRTAIGSVGKLAMSGRIVMRVQTVEHQAPLEYLRNASFDKYQTDGRHSNWSAAESKYAQTYPAAEDSWEFTSPATGATASATISMFLPRGVGILPFPHGPVTVSRLLAGEVETNRYGSVRVHDANSLARYTVYYGNKSTLDAPPTTNDLAVSALERPALEQIATELKLAGKPTPEILRRVEAFFLGKFSYSRYLKGAKFDPFGRTTALSQFLLYDHAGHCEYFASATTLLLRQAGVPARYAIGFAVPPEENHNHVHIVRALHAHAWVLAYVNGAWRDFDTTPGTWEGIEEAGKSSFQPVSDFFAGLWYQYSSWRFYGERGTLAKRSLWLLPLILLWFLWRLFSKKRQVRAKKVLPRDERCLSFGLDSEFYLIENHLAKAGVPRRPGESLHEWMRRLEAARQSQWSIPALRDIIALHYTYRFDPQGLSVERRSELKSKVESWLGNAVRVRN